MDFIRSVIGISLLIIGSMHITLFIRRLLVNIKVTNNTSVEINNKLDRIIALLEKQSK
ncbi:DUF4083 domain-containing protein [Paenibacillus endoradicis]|uniref:DUF4083 domain-containing protein n=1 Tax=Paenibacillus endoradicis TaxID=2972487 RepID=UPI002158DCCA|nr:DUF4083 domain-containing protein [Paenibacillus endoradicis]MCR8656745.1 DUF4083 domain-containing protein [Paenibacillus endoradicis]